MSLHLISKSYSLKGLALNSKCALENYRLNDMTDLANGPFPL